MERYQFLRGTENAMMDMALREENVDVILAAITDYYVREIEFWCKTDVDGIATWTTGVPSRRC